MTEAPRTTGSRRAPRGSGAAPGSPVGGQPGRGTGPGRSGNAEARAARIAAAKAERERKARTAKLRNLAIAIGTVLVVAIVAVVVASRHSSSTSTAAQTPAGLTTVTSPKPISGALYGPASAPVTITLFEDFQCPACERLETNAGSELTALADQGKVRIVYPMISFLDVNSKNQYSSRAANAWYCAPQANRKAFHTYLYAHQPAEETSGPSDAQLVAGAKTVGVSTPAFSQCVTSHRFSPFATGPQTQTLAGVASVGTPTMFVNGQLYPDAQNLTPAVLDQIVAQAAAH